MNETWLPIPGFPRYEVNKNLEVRNKRTGRLMKLNVRGEVRLRRPNKQEYAVRACRLLYAAIHGVDPGNIRRVVYYDEGNGRMTLIGDKELLAKMRDNRTYVSPDTCCDYYKEAQETIRTILDAYETEDFSRIADKIYQCEDFLTRYMIANLGVTSSETIREAFFSIAEQTLTSIKEKTATVYNVKPYLIRLTRAYFSKMHEINKRIVHYDEAVLRHNACDF